MHTPEQISRDIGAIISQDRLLINLMANNLDVQLNGKNPCDGIGLGLITILKCMDQLAGSRPVHEQNIFREGCMLFVLQWLGNADKARTVVKPGVMN